ncbi:alpha-2-macroglobulin family protein [Xanthocytophaga flava]|uniref:alpha-2-macroglobulin family protein n=1 Tax=Xanthocytophaga flava TaxID=3048013 RepID=UPI0028D26B89|nr:alpha-2-macroglobulin [Xanthocytophaga flavus]MDJ1468120.1 alpha-2-macroglobulin [Xanthocytophaga flavus]
MKQKIGALWMLGVIFLLISCRGNKVEINGRNFQDEIAQQQNLIFTFSHDLVGDTLIDKWDTTHYIEFEPQVRGKFKWTAPNELSFSPDAGFAPSTDYEAKVTDDLTSHIKTLDKEKQEKLSVGSIDPIKFHTPYLNLAGTDMYWVKNSEGNTELRFNVNFNYRVNPMQLGSLLAMNIDGKNVTAKVLSTEIASAIPVAVVQGGANFDKKAVQLTIREGLKCAESAYATPKPLEFKTEAPDKSDFQVVQVLNEYEYEKGVIRVYTNQTVEEGDIQRHITLSPSASFTIEKQDYGFDIKGNFKEGNYDLIISKRLRGIFGGALKEDFTQVVVFGEMKPTIAFTHKKSIYLSSKGSKNIGVRIINVPKIEVKIFKVYENNINAFFNQNSYDYSYEYESDYGPSYYFDEYGSPYGDIVYEKKILTNTLPKGNGVHLLNLDFAQFDDFKGIYIVKVRSDDEQYLQATQLVSISDIGFMVKETPDEVYVFANSILSAQPMTGVKVNLVSTNNQVLATGETDGDGVAKFADIRKKFPKFSIGMITGTVDKDFNYLLFSQTSVGTSRYEVGGIHENLSGYQAFIYGDRNIYRPGETINLNTVIRDGKWKSAGNIPVKVRIVLPNGKEYITQKGTLNDQGAFLTSVKLPVSAITGTYNAEVYTSNDVLLTSRSMSIEEFVPDRIKVTVKTSKPFVKSGDELMATATAVNLFGPPAANRSYEMAFNLTKKYFSAKEYPDYIFSPASEKPFRFEQDVRQGTTNDEGIAEESFTIPADFQDIGVLEGSIFTTVFDETGRPVNRVSRFDVYTQDVFYGMKLADSYVNTKEPVQLPLIAVNKDGKALQGVKAHLQVVKLNWQTVLQKNDYGQLSYVSQKKEQVLIDRSITINGTSTNFSFVPSVSGEYEVRLMRPGAENYISAELYAYGWGMTANTSFEVNREGQITIETNKAAYQVGETAEVLMKTPFPGRILVSVERNRVFEYYYVNTDKRSAKISIPIKADHLPNMYISATLIKPLDDGAMPLTVAHGYAAVTVEDPDRKMPVEIVASAQSRSQTKQTITIKTRPNAEVTLAVVDEGILQLTNYKTPDPHGYFFQKRALEVNAYDLYPQLFPDLRVSKSSVGGDGAGLEKRVNPLTNKRVKLVSFWSGKLTADGSGEITYTIDVPQFSGDLRIMAVAYKDDAFGSANTNMKVADPVVISSSLPRFFSPGDQLEMPVTLSNTTNKAGSLTAKVKVTGNLSVEGDDSQTINVNPNSEGRVTFAINAKDAVGAGQVIVEVNGLGGTYTEKNDITIRPIQSLLKRSGSGVVAGGTKNFNLTTDFIPSTTTGKLVVSRSPLVQFADDLDELLWYPYGCVEQTTSTAFPQLYFAELSKSLSKGKANATQTSVANYNVQEAINRLQTFQMYNGGLSYWPEGGQASWWGTTYAAHFLIEAQRAGFDVSETFLDKILSFLQQKVKQKDLEEYFYYNASNTRQTKQIAPKEIAYSLYVLALARRQDVPTMNYYKASKALLAIDSRYLLAAAYQMLGDGTSAKNIVPSAFSGERSVQALGGSFYSYIRDEAISLNALIDSDPKNLQIPIMAKHLSEQMKQKSYMNTQERAFGLLALGKLAKGSNAANVTGEVKAGNTSLGEAGEQDLVASKGVINQTISISPNGSGSLYYFWQAEGLTRSSTVKEEDSFLQVRKTFYDRFGNPISGNSFKQNDMVVIKITLATTDGSTVPNVVITDMLPAGFEIENPRISEVPSMNWAKDVTNPDYSDIRDDRINLFATATSYPRNYYYVVRAVSTGTFRMGPVQADAMYNGEYHSVNGAGQIKVVSRTNDSDSTGN